MHKFGKRHHHRGSCVRADQLNITECNSTSSEHIEICIQSKHMISTIKCILVTVKSKRNNNQIKLFVRTKNSVRARVRDVMKKTYDVMNIVY